MARATPSRRPLAGRVAVVAGATRGAGRGIARGLAEAGAIVYCTGRSVTGQPSPYKRPETIDETAAMIVAAGGAAVAVRVDHAVESEVEALFERIDKEHGRVDVVVNSIAGEDPLMGPYAWFWDADLTNGAAAFRNSLLSHIVTAKHAARHMMRRQRGLIVEVTENNIMSAGGNPVAQAVKLSQKGMALTMGAELQLKGVAVVAITPGFLRSESMLEHFGVTEANWKDGGKTDSNFLSSESPLFIGRAVAALAADPNILKRTGQLLSSWELSRDYKFTDADSSRPDWGQIKIDLSMLPTDLADLIRSGSVIQLEWLKTLHDRTRSFIKQLSPRRAGASAPAKSKKARASANPRSRARASAQPRRARASARAKKKR